MQSDTGPCPCCDQAEPEASGHPDRRQWLAGALVGLALPAGTAQARTVAQGSRQAGGHVLQIASTVRQSGFLIGQTVPGAVVTVDDIAVQPDGAGRFIAGFDRDAPAETIVSATAPDGQTASARIAVTARDYVVRSIRGLPSATVNPPESAMARIRSESALKQRAFGSVDDRETGWLESFDWPLDNVRITSPWGAQRSLNGALQRPHYGVDMGAATGTPIRAPASGIVVMAETDMFYEGGMVTLDHGQGLMTTYLHMNRVDVRVGQRLQRGVQLGHVGARGRATGPHLCWRMRWRGRQLDPTLKLSRP
ncbi:MAG: M23 family metallopeptidase [Hyphomonadaceae bacterium]|nr:M23 family metallopeptidase [Hyphomonadaceae bacterium]